ncbi:MAG TPA: hypothetical protein VLB83_04800 [Candidatus Paceibacterota bacterium]|nr:hypothetical protein [Candidatus Paceibacterota bacterium]
MGEGLPEEIVVGEQELQVDENGKRFAYEKDGVKYGGDYLPETPAEIDPNFPSASEEVNPAM